MMTLDQALDTVSQSWTVFTNLTEATVEVWARWDSFPGYVRIFEFGIRKNIVPSRFAFRLYSAAEQR
jgi:hypothetical protein